MLDHLHQWLVSAPLAFPTQVLYHMPLQDCPLTFSSITLWSPFAGSSRYPLPPLPQIRGTDASNLAMTRVVQRDVWQHQFPPGDCSSSRLLVFAFPPGAHGLGSHLHILAEVLDLAMTNKRVLTLFPGTFWPADYDACQGKCKASERWRVVGGCCEGGGLILRMLVL